MTTPHDPALRALLRRADPAADMTALPAGDFSAGVHRRIRAEDTAALRAADGFGRQLFPLAAALAMLASIGAGSAVAYARERDAHAETFAAAYARNIDPWQKHGAPESRTPDADTHAAHRHP